MVMWLWTSDSVASSNSDKEERKKQICSARWCEVGRSQICESGIYALLSPLIVLHILPDIMHRDGEYEGVPRVVQQFNQRPVKLYCQHTSFLIPLFQSKQPSNNTHFNSFASFSFNFAAFSFQKSSDSCTGVQLR